MFDWFVTGFTAVLLWLSVNGFQPSHIAAGFFGAVARAFVAKSGTLPERVFEGFLGSLFAVYLTPIVAIFLGTTDLQMSNAIAFAVGLLGVYIASGIIIVGKRYAKQPMLLKDDFRDILLHFLTPKK